MVKKNRNVFGYQMLLFLGLCALLHAGYSTIQYRRYLRMVDQDYTGSPLDVHLECLIGCALSLLGVVGIADDLEPVRLAETYHDKALDDVSFRPEFMTFNHRGRVLGLLSQGAPGQGSSKKTN